MPQICLPFPKISAFNSALGLDVFGTKDFAAIVECEDKLGEHIEIDELFSDLIASICEAAKYES